MLGEEMDGDLVLLIIERIDTIKAVAEVTGVRW